MSFQTQGFDPIADGADLRFGGVLLHDDQHEELALVSL